MKKTGSQIEADIYEIIRSSSLSAEISGVTYKEGTRPINSVKEDIVVNFLTGVDEDEFQEGFVNVNIYVPDIDNSGGGILVKDVARCSALEVLILALLESNSLSGDYLLRAAQTIKTFKEESIKQHFINCKIKFRLSNL